MRNFLVTEDGLVVFDGVLFSDGTVIVHGLPPLNMTIIHATLDQALAAMEGMHIEWQNGPWFPTAAGN